MHRLAGRLRSMLVGQPSRASSPQGRFTAGASRLDGQVAETVEAWGKHLAVRYPDELVLHIHLGLFGRCRVLRRDWDPDRTADEPPITGQVRLRLMTSTHYADLRGPTACELLTPADWARVLARLGPDPLRPDADPDLAWSRISRSRRELGQLFIDQAVIAGIGNVYRSELLWRRRLDPFGAGRQLPQHHFDALWDDLVRLMPLGVASGRIVTREADIVSVRAALDAGKVPRGRTGYEAYYRAGQPCSRCSTPIATQAQANRSLFWCPSCQQ